MTTSSNKAYLYLVKIISGRDYPESKLRQKLQEKKFQPEEIELAINEIKARGYLREDIYIEGRIRVFMEKGYSPSYIRHKLAEERLSVTDEEVEIVFNLHRLSPEVQIDRLIRKKLQGKIEFDYALKNKVLRFVLSKGHDFEDSKKIMKSIINETSVRD